MRLPKLLDRIAEPVGLSADLVTWATAIAVGGPVLLGVLAQSLVVTLASLGVGLSLICLGLAYMLRRRQRAELRDRRAIVDLRRANRTLWVRITAATTLAGAAYEDSDRRLEDYRGTILSIIESLRSGETTSAQPEAAADIDFHQTHPSLWMPDPANLASFCMTEQQLAELVSSAADLAKSELGPDATGFLEDILLYCDFGPRVRTPIIRIGAWSKTSTKKKRFVYQGAPDDFASHGNAISEADGPNAAEAPWVLDTNFRRLVHDSWRRMQPFHGVVVLSHTEPGYLGVDSPWYICYLDLDVRTKAAGDATLFALRGGVLERLGAF